jgi:phosphate-selective porin OprO/OprP
MGGARAAVRVVVVVGCLFAVTPSRGQDAVQSARERELEDLVRRLNGRLEQLEQRVNELEQGKADRQTEERVGTLEEDVQQIKESKPAPVDPEQWKQMEKWVNDPHTLRPYWKDGLRLDSADGAFKLKIGGRIHTDFAYFLEEGSVERAIGEDFDDNAEFRRARLYISGDIYDNMSFKAQYDFAGGDADFKDVYIGFKKVPFAGNLKIGHFKEPFSLEELTSSNHITFLERSLSNVFAPSRNIGVMAYDDLMDERMTWAVGLFRQTDDAGEGVAGRAYDVTARVTGLPVYEDEGAKLVHVGASYSFQNFEDDVTRYRSRPESHLSPYLVDTGNFSADSANLVGVEAALVQGPFSLQGEWVQTFVDGRRRFTGNPDFCGSYLQASYFLTGEHRPYKKSSGTFDNVKPKKNFNVEGGGPGAWELALRYSYLDLNDGRIEGGRLRDLAFGVNWYLNPNLRMMWNYVWADPSYAGDVGIFQWRFQIAF